MIGFYLNASEKIGLGHYNRSLLIFNLIKEKSIFFTKSHKLRNILNKEKKRFCFIKNQQSLPKLFLEKKITILFIDLKKFDQKILKFLSKNKHIFVVVIADNHKKVKNAHLTFFPEITIKKKNKVYSGKKFVLIPRLPIKKKIYKVKNILISMGGSDPYNITKKVIKQISKMNLDIKLNIVFGKFYKHNKLFIKTILKKPIQYKIYKNQKNLNFLMLKNDLLITNSGITKYEAFAMKLPSLIISNSKNANFDQKTFSSLGGSVFVGDHKLINIKKLNKLILNLVKNKKIINRMQKCCKNYFDGQGANRILKIVNNEYEKNIISRRSKKSVINT